MAVPRNIDEFRRLRYLPGIPTSVDRTNFLFDNSKFTYR